MNCHNCTTPIPNEARFCSKCGSGVQSVEPNIKASKKLLASVVVIGGVLLLAVVLGSMVTPSAGSGGATGGHSVVYEVGGTASKASITIKNQSGGTEQHTVPVPYRTSFTVYKPHSFLYLSAQNKGRDGTLVVSIEVDGKPIQVAESSAAFGIATASGSIR